MRDHAEKAGSGSSSGAAQARRNRRARRRRDKLRAALAPRELRRPAVLFNLTLVLVITLLDALTPAGIVVGVLLAIPILASSLSPHRTHVALIGAVSMLGFLLIRVFRTGPMFPREIWLPNRILVLFTLAGTTFFALWLNRARLRAERDRDEAIRTGRLNELLVSLLAHDLRSPLALTGSALDYVLSRPPTELDRGLIRDVASRVRRSLGTVDRLLAVGSTAPEPPVGPADTGLSPEVLLRELEDEARSAEEDAARRHQRIVVECGMAEGIAPDAPLDADPVAARHALGILIDNAARHAVPGEIRVRLRVEPEWLVAEVEDQGPGLGNADPAGTGAGVGLRLCRSLAELFGGSLELVRSGPEGSLFRLRLPARAIDDPAH